MGISFIYNGEGQSQVAAQLQEFNIEHVCE